MSRSGNSDDYGHEWTELGNLTLCMKCGWLKESKKARSECKGPPGISLRNAKIKEVENEMTEDQIKHMAARFCGWKLPENFNPDAGISFKPTFNDWMETPMRHNPTGTNLFTYDQAIEMVRYMVKGMPNG